ncbi:CDP-glycerol glycerophosphotransferase family protein [Sphingomonas sp. RHCKR47]|uniref:CDP-glycerol glycerophosphotransferase family protein n=1 Tax=Sphingomonas citricola TaxID=2862498 RepID=UPI001CA5A479|nr:CDP-glycerol glycerophosphotransferase family protein [Sphingomonas citricola]MBW6524897.1 CDP-glycerol glycerophosphotransferase family protein [Sphingomonas citricola]
MTAAPVAFLFLGETLLIPHLFPVVEALADARADLPLDLWVSTSTHEDLLAGWTADMPQVRIRRAPGFRRLAATTPGERPVLPPKLPMLLRLAPRLARTSIVVCAEQTSLWLPRAFPWMRTRFVKTSHGVGSMSARDDRRRMAAAYTLVPSEQERATYLARGMAPDRIEATGYVKAAFRQRTPARALFTDDRPVLLYTPHWQAHRSSWPAWGPQVVEHLAAQRDWNVILAPHQRLIERAPELRETLARVADLPHVHVDLDSFATVDGSYTAAADLYLGDTSSQLIEFLARPRPAVFLNALGRAWADDPAYAMWRAGEVVDDLADLIPAIARAPARHACFAATQRDIAGAALGDASGAGARRAADAVLRVLANPRPRR